MNDRWIVRLLVLFVLVAVAGCVSSTDDDDHLEHHIPAHKPKDFAAAVRELEPRYMALVQDLAAEARPKPIELAELRDIIAWLPELAAETEMAKTDWESVQRISGELTQIVDSVVADGPAPSALDPNKYSALVKQLSSLPDFSDSSLTANQPDPVVGSAR